MTTPTVGSTAREQIRQKAVELLDAAPEGIRFGELRAAVHAALPHIPMGTVHGNVWQLDTALPETVRKPARGLFVHAKYDAAGKAGAKLTAAAAGKVKEEQFYQPFADWLVDDLEECTKATPVGGSKFKDKWGTPDVVGVRAPKKSDIIQFPTEIVAAELKIDGAGLITAFGQACAYKLFAHRSYIVVPKQSPTDDIARLDGLCTIVGIGLILFDATKPTSPEFSIRVRAARHDPDMFYVNKNMKELEEELFG